MQEYKTSGKVYLVGAGPGDPELITLKGYEILKKCDVIIFDGLVNQELLRYTPKDSIKIFIGESRHEKRITQDEVNDLMIFYSSQNKIVVRLKGGDPFIFARGGEEAIALNNAGIEWEVVPGISSGIAAPAYAGIPLTHRGVSSSVAFITGHECGSKDRQVDIKKIASSVDTLVIFMGIRNFSKIVNELISNGIPEYTPVAIIEKGTCSDQRILAGTLENILNLSGEINSPALIIIGKVVKLRKEILRQPVSFDKSNELFHNYKDFNEVLSYIS
jgi:uroporphyrin-III C-methyltransferase